LGVPARRWLRRRLGRWETEPDPTYAWRIGAAFVTAVADVLLPSLVLGTIALAIWLLVESDTLLPSLAISGCLGGIIYFVLTGLSRAVLAPQAPAWRILPITEEGAVVLNRRVRIVALYIAVLDVLYRTAASLGLLQSPEFKTASTLFLDAALVGLLLTLLPSRFWHTEEEASRVVVGVSITLGALLVAIPVLDLVGFSALASYLLWGLVITVVATGFALLLRVAGHEALAQILRPASTLRLRLYRWLRLGEGAAKVLRILGNLLVDLTLFLTLAYGLLRFYGLPDALLFHWLKRFAKGIPIGNVLLSPIDIFMAILVFAGILLATGMLRRWLAEKLRTGTRLDLGMRNAIVSGLGYGGWVLAIVIAITTIGLDLSNLALVAGALSVGVGFGLRTVVENFVAGLLLLIERPIKEGDWIVTAGYQGTVKRISVRSTEIETFDRASVILPNAELIAQPVQNWTHKSRMARIIVPVGVAYGSDTAKVSDILRACAEEHPEVQRYPEPYIIFQQFGASSLDFELRCYVKDTDFVMTCKSDLNFAIDKAFREQGIEIPFPQRDLHLREKSPLHATLTDGQPAALASSSPSPAKAYGPSRRRRDAETNGGETEE
jgi:small-conductance mechanosensitive channel